MDKPEFWSINGQLWESLEEFKNVWSDKSRGNKLLEDADLDKFLINPLEYVDELYGQKTGPIDVWERQVLAGLHYKLLAQKISNLGDQNMTIPCLNDPDVLKVKNGQAVTFRCMIQNVMDSDFWPHQVTIKDPVTGQTKVKSTLLRDASKDIEDMSDEGGLIEKEGFVAITPPGESAWVSRLDFNGTDGLASECKRMKLGEGEEGIVTLPNYKDFVPILFQHHDDAKPVACFLKMLQGYNTTEVKPNDLVEVTGLIYFDDVTEQEEDKMKEILPCGFHKLPVIHVFSCIKLADGLPQLPLIEGKMFQLVKAGEINVTECARVLRELLSLALGGDRYAAAYAMTALAARVLQRDIPTHGAIGKFALNISGLPEKSEIVNEFQFVLKAIVPRTLKLDVTIENMNAWVLTPSIGRLEPTVLEPNVLQIASGTHVILNETNLEEGTLNDAGVHNVEVLRELIMEQQVKYDYIYQFPSLPTHVTVVCFSTSPTILPNDIRIAIKSDQKVSLEERRVRIEQLLSEHCEKLRVYLGIARSISLTSHDLFVDKSLQEDFEAFYRTRNQPTGFNTKMSAQEFSAFITSCRLWCLLHGHLSITREGFNFWKEVELIRDSRFAPASA